MDITVQHASFLALLVLLSLLQPHRCYGDSTFSCKDDERAALLQFKGGLKDPGGRLSTWDVGRDCCSWPGVECNNRTGHVTRLDLGGFRVEGGEISPSLIALHDLSYLDLSRNNFSGASIPKSMGSFKRLMHLDLSNTSLAGRVPSELANLSSLSYLDLSDNNLSGSILALGQLDELVDLYLGNNKFDGVVTNVHFENLTRLKRLNLSSNYGLRVKIGPAPIFPHLEYINLGNCIVGPSFPSWLQKMGNISVIRMYNAGISDVMPDWFWNFSSTNFWSIDLSNNMIRGKLPSSLAHLTRLWYLNMRNNQLEGPFPRISNVVSYLILNNNSISGPIPSNIGDNFGMVVLFVSANKLSGSIPTSTCKMKELTILDLSHNQLSGEIPHCLGNSSSLETIDLGNNNLSGEIPASIGTLRYLESLHLASNNLSGGLPSTLMNSTSLKTLDLGNNKLYGSIPTWLGSNFEFGNGGTMPTCELNNSLYTLNLRSNMFIGKIPPGLGNLPCLKVIDLSQNMLSGSIPESFENLRAMKSSYGKIEDNGYYSDVMSADNSYEEYNSVRVITKGRYEEYGKLLKWWVSIDLSSNSLSGEIPEGLATLSRLQNLNLSRNHFTGSIPRNVAGLQHLESLDLSYNNLTGEIPESMTELNSLGVMNFSFNNLSGRIPGGEPFQSHPDPSIYLGNHYLCGFPLITSPCGGSVPSGTPQSSNGSQDKDEEIIWFYLSMAPGFAIGFWAFVGALLLKEKWRIAYYRYVDSVYDKIYVFIAIKLAHMERP